MPALLQMLHFADPHPVVPTSSCLAVRGWDLEVLAALPLRRELALVRQRQTHAPEYKRLKLETPSLLSYIVVLESL